MNVRVICNKNNGYVYHDDLGKGMQLHENINKCDEGESQKHQKQDDTRHRPKEKT
jgi:hypothetical protein